MSSNEQASTPQQQKPRQVKPPFADWPTIKILTPPQGPFLPKTDEWCFTYCAQSVSGRINGKEPNCRTVCLRKVFPHEVRNILSFRRHKSVGPDGKAHYPLPAEGQTINLPRALGGQPEDDSEESPSTHVKPPTKHWHEGWYLWTGKGREAVIQSMEKMLFDLPSQNYLDAKRKERRELWHDYEQSIKQNPDYKPQGKAPVPWWIPMYPPRPESSANMAPLLVQLPPETPAIWDWGRVKKLLAPTFLALDIFRDSITSGDQVEFGKRVWEKAKTDEPWILARRCLSGAYEKWKKPDIAEDDEKKGST